MDVYMDTNDVKMHIRFTAGIIGNGTIIDSIFSIFDSMRITNIYIIYSVSFHQWHNKNIMYSTSILTLYESV